MAAYRIIEHQRRLLKENEHKGLISEKDKDSLNEKLDKRISMINKLQPETLYIAVNKATVFQMSFPMFRSLTEEQIERLFQNRSKEEFKKQSKFH
jgi:methyl coenzyme M reductase gamma subunit